MHQMIHLQKGKEGTAQPLPPVEAVMAYDGLDVVLIDKGIAAAGAGQAVELEGIDDGIVRILG